MSTRNDNDEPAVAVNDNPYVALAALDISRFVEKKDKYSYLSWAYAVDQLLRADPRAHWEFKWFESADGYHPYCRMPEGFMVFCTVRAFGIERTAHLPVIDNRNNTILKPDAMDINSSMQRCLVKGIALHGLGINLYVGEDLPITVADEADRLAKDMQAVRSFDDLNDLAEKVDEFIEQYPQFRNFLAKVYSDSKAAVVGRAQRKAQQKSGLAGLKDAMGGGNDSQPKE